jgi:putative oxidoreductase
MTKTLSESMPYVLSIVRFLLGFLFIQHGLEKLWGFAGGRVDRDFSHLHGLAGPIELTGGVLLILGLFIRPTAFILCGEMAVAYFVTWAPHGFWPISNGVGGELAVIDCFAFLWLVTAGAGPLSLDALITGRKGLGAHNIGLAATLASREGYARSILRVVLAFLISLHGFRMVFGMFPPPPIRFKRAPMALDALPGVLGLICILGGLLLLLGFLTRATALVLWLQAAAAYFVSAAPRGPVPMRTGGEEVALYFILFSYFIVAGAGLWSLDHLLQTRRRGETRSVEIGAAIVPNSSTPKPPPRVRPATF